MVHFSQGEPLKILLYDIESSLQPVAVFQLQQNDFIKPENILAERHLVSVCWKWLGEKKVYSVSLLDDPKRFKRDPHDDYHVVKTIHEVMGEADLLIGHNSDAFDKRYIDTRALFHGLPILPPIASVDTYKVAKQRLLLNSNSLNYLGNYLGLGGKKHTPQGLWLDVLRGDRKAIKTMVEYNKRDVTLLEQVFMKLRPYVQNHLNRELFGEIGCPTCGSKKYQSRGVYRAISRVYQRFQCNACHHWFRSVRNDRSVKPQFRVL